MNLEELLPDIFHINVDTQEELMSTFLRFQEHLESPEFRGRTFSLEEYKQWYIANSHEGKETGKFTYYSDYTGANLPSEILEPFYEGKFDPISEKERMILDLFRNKRGTRFYIIGTNNEEGIEEQKNVLRHEIAHGLFYTNPEYRADIRHVLNWIKQERVDEITRFFQTDRLYHESVWEDEMHAWIMCEGDLETLAAEGIDISDLLEISQNLNLVFESHIQR